MSGKKTASMAAAGLGIRSGQAAPAQRSGVFVRLSEQDKARAQYWADKEGFDSLGEYVAEAVIQKNQRQNQDYDLPTLEIARLTQLLDAQNANTRSVENLQRVVVQMMETFIGMTRGSSVLLDEPEDGELDG